MGWKKRKLLSHALLCSGGHFNPAEPASSDPSKGNSVENFRKKSVGIHSPRVFIPPEQTLFL
jgi:hypothetical protein